VAEHKALVRFGELEITEGVVSAKVTSRINEPTSAEIVISKAALIASKPDYQAGVQIFVDTDEDQHHLFAGFTVAAEPQQAGTLITTTTDSQKLRETKTGGLSFNRVDGREVIWAILRSSGMEEDKIQIEEYEPGPLEVFEVASALDGITVERPTAIGDVRLLPEGRVSCMADGLGPEELEDRYTGGSAWAFTLKTARTLYDAETEGLREIDAALAWLTTRAHYSSVRLPKGEVRRFRRDWTMARTSRRDVVVARGVSTGRRWLRSPLGIAYRPELIIHEIEDLESLPLPPDISPQMREAFLAWRRAAEESDPLAAVVALWECAEFYVSGVSVDQLFTKPERRAVQNRATEGLEGVQLQRAREVVGRLNEAPLLVRLRAALDQDGVPCTEGELTLLRDLRQLRNDFVHGESRNLPSEADLRYAKAIVNRMLVYRLGRLCQPSPISMPSGGSVPDLLRSLSER
jgi:hypothetical protein